MSYKTTAKTLVTTTWTCDNCGHEEQTHLVSYPPEGWLTITRDKWSDRTDYCMVACAWKALAAQ